MRCRFRYKHSQSCIALQGLERGEKVYMVASLRTRLTARYIIQELAFSVWPMLVPTQMAVRYSLKLWIHAAVEISKGCCGRLLMFIGTLHITAEITLHRGKHNELSGVTAVFHNTSSYTMA